MRSLKNIRGYFYNEMRYIDLRFSYLLTYKSAVSTSRKHLTVSGGEDYGRR